MGNWYKVTENDSDKYRDNKFKGLVGEHLTRAYLQEYCNMKCVNNIVIYSKRHNKSAEIDIVGINEYGLFIIENKNWNALVLNGNEHEDEELELYYGSLKYPEKAKVFYQENPVFQNNNHEELLLSWLDEKNYSIVPIHNFVILNDNIQYINTNTKGYKRKIYKLTEFVKIYEDNKQELFNTNKSINNKQLNFLYNQLKLCSKEKEIKESIIGK